MKTGNALKFLILPNVSTHYDQRMVHGLAAGFRHIGQQAVAFDAPSPPDQLPGICREQSIDVVIQINRTRNPSWELPANVRHIAWFQDVFPETLTDFASNFQPEDILYALGDPHVLGLNVDLPCPSASLVSGVDPALFNFTPTAPAAAIDFSLCGFIPSAFPHQKSPLRFLFPHSPRYQARQSIVQLLTEHYAPLRGHLDIHGLSVLIRVQLEQEMQKSPTFHHLDQWISTKLNKLTLQERVLSYFTREYPRFLDRQRLIDLTLKVSDSLELYGPGWQTHPAYAPYAKGFITDQTGLLEVYSRSRINLANNTHGLGLHSRTLECMAIGGFIFTHSSPNDEKPGGLLTSFTPDQHFGIFSPENFRERAKYWLDHEKERKEAGKLAQGIVKKSHCWHHRAQQIVNDLKL